MARSNRFLSSHRRLLLAFTASLCAHVLGCMLTYFNYLEHAPATTKAYLKAELKTTKGRAALQTLPSSTTTNQISIQKSEFASVETQTSTEKKSDSPTNKPNPNLRIDSFPSGDEIDSSATYTPEMMFYQSPYLPSNALTVPPHAITAINNLENNTTLPIIASGKVTLKLWIDQNGSVTTSEVESTNMPEQFSKAAASAFHKVIFSPGEINGQRVGSIIRVEVDYEDFRLTIQ